MAHALRAAGKVAVNSGSLCSPKPWKSMPCSRIRPTKTTPGGLSDYRVDTNQLHLAVEQFDPVCSDAVREFIHEVEPVGVVVVLRDKRQRFAIEGANYIVLMGIMLSEIFRYVPR